MSKKSRKTQKKNWFKGLKAEFKQNHLAGQADTCKTDSGSSFCIRSVGSNHRSD